MACGSTGEDNVWLLLRKGKASESKHCLHEMSSRQAKKIASWLSLSLSLSDHLHACICCCIDQIDKPV